MSVGGRNPHDHVRACPRSKNKGSTTAKTPQGERTCIHIYIHLLHRYIVHVDACNVLVLIAVVGDCYQAFMREHCGKRREAVLAFLKSNVDGEEMERVIDLIRKQLREDFLVKL